MGPFRCRRPPQHPRRSGHAGAATLSGGRVVEAFATTAGRTAQRVLVMFLWQHIFGVYVNGLMKRHSSCNFDSEPTGCLVTQMCCLLALQCCYILFVSVSECSNPIQVLRVRGHTLSYTQPSAPKFHHQNRDILSGTHYCAYTQPSITIMTKSRPTSAVKRDEVRPVIGRWHGSF
jgi:hypothetical protein